MNTAIKTFNTGRPYTANGQLIGYMVLSKEIDATWDMDVFTVLVVDASRGMYILVEIIGEEPTPSGIMRLYDAGRYAQVSKSEHFSLCDTIEKELSNA